MTQTLQPSLPPDAPDGPEVRGVVRLTGRQLRFQRRVTLIVTILPLVGLATAAWRTWGQVMSGLDLTLLVSFYLFTGIGITVGYHRLFTHRSFTARPALRVVLAAAASMAVQGGVLSWCANHRRHHAYADQHGDPHSPHLAQAAGIKGVLLGLWHSHVGWLFGEEKSDENVWVPDLLKEPAMVRIQRWFPQLTVVSFALPAVIGFAFTGTLRGTISAFVWGSLVRVFLLHHVTWSINSVCHFYGKEAYQASDESRNVWPMAPISFGESWHNNHHAFPWSARLGLKPWQVDPGWYVIRMLELVRLVKGVKVPSIKQLQMRKLSR